VERTVSAGHSLDARQGSIEELSFFGARLNVIQNWFEELKGLAPGN
jgi:hypothetical protein